MTDEQCKKICNCISGLTFALVLGIAVAALSASLNIHALGQKIVCVR